MKPAGPGRNREIAEIRGDDKPICKLPEMAFCCPNYEEYRTVGCPKHCEYYGFKPYSTDISASMELAREMHSSGDKTADQLLHDAWNWWMAGDNSSLQELAGAISGAWLKWKGQ